MQFFYREHGQGQPIVIFHGWLGMSEHWDNIAKYLANNGYHVVIPDLPNHGKSFHTEEFSYSEMAAILDSFCDAMKLKNPILIGHSMGGKIAMQIANDNPDKYKSLILVDTHFKSYIDSSYHIEFAKFLNNINLSDFSNLEVIKNYLLENNIEKGWIALVLKNLHYKDKQLRWKSNLKMLTSSIVPILDSISINQSQIPTLLTRGADSDYVNNNDIVSFKEKFQNSEVITIPNAGHWVQIENPAMFLATVMDFLKKL